MEPEKWLDGVEAAKYLDMHPSTMREYMRRGVIRAKKTGKKWVALRESLDEYRVRRDEKWPVKDIISEVAKSFERVD
jgi:excisionase family DNA binding protein